MNLCVLVIFVFLSFQQWFLLFCLHFLTSSLKEERKWKCCWQGVQEAEVHAVANFRDLNKKQKKKAPFTISSHQERTSIPSFEHLNLFFELVLAVYITRQREEGKVKKVLQKKK